MGTSWKNPLTYAGVYCSDTLFIMQVLYRIIYCDDNVVMMPKGREQVLRSAQGVHNSSSVLCMMFCAHWVRIFLRTLRSYINKTILRFVMFVRK